MIVFSQICFIEQKIYGQKTAKESVQLDYFKLMKIILSSFMS